MFARTCLLFGVVCQNCEHDCKFRPCFISQVLCRIYPTWRLLECATSDCKFDAHPILDGHSIEFTFCTPSNPPFAQLKLHQEGKGINWQVQFTTIGDIIGHAPCSSVIVYGRIMGCPMHAPMEALSVCYFLNYLSVSNLAHLTILPLLC